MSVKLQTMKLLLVLSVFYYTYPACEYINSDSHCSENPDDLKSAKCVLYYDDWRIISFYRDDANMLQKEWKPKMSMLHDPDCSRDQSYLL